MSIDADALRAPVTNPFEDVQFWETKRQITHAEARESATRLINSHFRNEDRARVSIPANPDRDDDLIIQSYIRQQARAARSGDLIHLSKISEETARAGEWQPIETAPKDGTVIDLVIDGSRLADAYWGTPPHTCGEAGHLCDSCPSYEGWCDVFGYLTGEEGSHFDLPTHWRPLPSPPALPPTEETAHVER